MASFTHQIKIAAEPAAGLLAQPPHATDTNDHERVKAQVAWHRLWGYWPGMAANMASGSDAYAALTRESGRKKMLALLQVKAIQDIHTALAASAIEHLWMKGPLLSKRLYDDFTVRSSVDLDVMVAEADVPAVDAQMRALGYMPCHRDKIPASWPVICFYLKDLSYRHRETGVCVEVHWRWEILPSVLPLSFKEAFSRHQTIALGKQAVPVMSAEDEFIYLCMHGAKSCWARMQWLLDIRGFVMQGQLDWPVIEQRARRWGMLADVTAALVLLESVFALPLPADFAERLRHSDQVQRTLSVTLQAWQLLDYPPLKQRLMHQWHSRSTWRHKIEFISRRLTSIDDALLLPDALRTPWLTTVLWPVLVALRVVLKKTPVLAGQG